MKDIMKSRPFRLAVPLVASVVCLSCNRSTHAVSPQAASAASDSSPAARTGEATKPPRPLGDADFQKIEAGMSLDQVTKLLGEPCFQRVVSENLDMVWQNERGNKGLYVTFKNQEVMGTAILRSGHSTLQFSKGTYHKMIFEDAEYQKELFGLLRGAPDPDDEATQAKSSGDGNDKRAETREDRRSYHRHRK
jgi:hypothetical protein